VRRVLLVFSVVVLCGCEDFDAAMVSLSDELSFANQGLKLLSEDDGTCSNCNRQERFFSVSGRLSARHHIKGSFMTEKTTPKNW
jgi:hypothetical protein